MVGLREGQRVFISCTVSRGEVKIYYKETGLALALFCPLATTVMPIF